MSHEFLYRGNDIDISKTFDGVEVFAVTDGKEQKIEITSMADIEVLYAMLGEVINKDYAVSQLRSPLDYDLEGC